MQKIKLVQVQQNLWLQCVQFALLPQLMPICVDWASMNPSVVVVNRKFESLPGQSVVGSEGLEHAAKTLLHWESDFKDDPLVALKESLK